MRTQIRCFSVLHQSVQFSFLFKLCEIDKAHDFLKLFLATLWILTPILIYECMCICVCVCLQVLAQISPVIYLESPGHLDPEERRVPQDTKASEVHTHTHTD